LFIFSSIVLLLEAIKLFDESFDFTSIIGNLGQAVVLDLLLFDLDLLVLLLEVTELFLESAKISLSVSQFIDV